MINHEHNNVLNTETGICLSRFLADHDDNYDAEEWNYNGRDVLRGCVDPLYPEWNVYWLYDENLTRVGLAEHDQESPEVFHSLWFHDNPFGTLFQETGWKKRNVTLWSLLSAEAYQDCLEDDFKTVFDRALSGNIRLMNPEMITNLPKVYSCVKCNKKSLSPLTCSDVTVLSYLFSEFSILFLDDSFIIYEAPSNSRVWSLLSLKPPHDASAPQGLVPELQPTAQQPDRHRNPHPPEQEPASQTLQEQPPTE